MLSFPTSMAHYDRDLEAALAASLEEELRQALAASEQSAARDEQLRQDAALAHRVAVDDEEDDALAAALAASMADVPSTSTSAPVEDDALALDFAVALSLEEWEAPSTSAQAGMDPAMAAFAAAVRREHRQRRPVERPRRGDTVVTPEDRRQEQILADWRT